MAETTAAGNLVLARDARYVRAVVSSRRDLERGLWIVRLRPEEPLRFLPGQYVTVGIPGETKVVERPYSVVSSPREPELEFFLELVPEGELTPQLYNLAVGAQVYIRRAPKGRFLFDTASGHAHHCMVASVTGVAPFVSMLREWVARAAAGERPPEKIFLLQSASVSSELGYYHELTGYARRFEWIRYVATISRPWLDPEWQGEVGRADDVLRKYLDALGFQASGTTAYVCGNPHMIQNLKGILHRARFAKEQIQEELYWIAK